MLHDFFRSTFDGRLFEQAQRLAEACQNPCLLVEGDTERGVEEEYNGSKTFIKKNSRFKVAADLYKMNGTLCIRVNEVVEILS